MKAQGRLHYWVVGRFPGGSFDIFQRAHLRDAKPEEVVDFRILSSHRLLTRAQEEVAWAERNVSRAWSHQVDRDPRYNQRSGSSGGLVNQAEREQGRQEL